MKKKQMKPSEWIYHNDNWKSMDMILGKNLPKNKKNNIIISSLIEAILDFLDEHCEVKISNKK